MSAQEQENTPQPAANSNDAVAEAAALKDQLLRALAEIENVKKRAERDRQETSKYAVTNLARDILQVPDNLRRAIESVPAEARGGDGALKNLLTGIEMTEKLLLSVMEQHGIRRIDALGRPFDYNLHQAMGEVDDPTQPAGTVVQQMQAGYTLHDRLLRPAMVLVTKGGAAPDGGSRSGGESPASTGFEGVDTTA